MKIAMRYGFKPAEYWAMPIREAFMLFECAEEDREVEAANLSHLMWAAGSTWKRGTTPKKFFEQFTGAGKSEETDVKSVFAALKEKQRKRKARAQRNGAANG